MHSCLRPVKKAKRFALPNSEVMIHQPLIAGGGLSGQTTDIKIYTDHLVNTKKKMNEILTQSVRDKLTKSFVRIQSVITL